MTLLGLWVDKNCSGIYYLGEKVLFILDKMSNKNNPWDSNSNQEGRRKSADGFYKFNMNNVSKILPNGFGKNYLLLVLVIVIAAWLSSGFYVVQPNQEGVELRFGRYTMTSTPGLHYHLPLPIEKVFLVDVTTINHEEIGYRSGRVAEDLLPESLMLTGDENIVDINFEIQWHIKDARQYLFNLRDDRQGMTVQAAGESAMREVAGKNKIGYIIEGVGRAAIAKETQDILQKTLDEYQMGVQVVSVQMKKADPPARVIDSFRDVQTARADKERTINQAYAYKNEIIPKVRGEAEQILNEARAYQYQVVNQSVGDTERFLRLYEQYKQNKFVTKKRLYLETIEEVLGDKEKLIFTNKSIMPLMSVTDMLKTKGVR